MTAYQVLLLCILVLWPVVIFGLLFLMSRLENYVNRVDAETPEEAGLEPVGGQTREREVQIRFGDQVIGEPSPVGSAADGNGAEKSHDGGAVDGSDAEQLQRRAVP